MSHQTFDENLADWSKINFSLHLLFIIASNAFFHTFLYQQTNSTFSATHDSIDDILSIIFQSHKFYWLIYQILLKVTGLKFYTLLVNLLWLTANILVANSHVSIMWDFYASKIQAICYFEQVFFIVWLTHWHCFAHWFYSKVSFWVLNFQTFSFHSHRFFCSILNY